MSLIEVATMLEIPVGKTKHVEVQGEEILIANVNGKFYAVSDRCGHQNAPLSKGAFDGRFVTCPLHGARFDVTTGKMASGPVAHNFPGIDVAPKELLKELKGIGEMTSLIKVHNLETFEVKTSEGKILLKVN